STIEKKWGRLSVPVGGGFNDRALHRDQPISQSDRRCLVSECKVSTRASVHPPRAESARRNHRVEYLEGIPVQPGPNSTPRSPADRPAIADARSVSFLAQTPTARLL